MWNYDHINRVNVVKISLRKKKGTTAPVLEQHGLLCAQLLRIRSEEPASCNFETELGL
jgi:hypothetical protein